MNRPGHSLIGSGGVAPPRNHHVKVHDEAPEAERRDADNGILTDECREIAHQGGTQSGVAAAIQ